MRKCSNCGMTVDEDAKYCTNCGKKVWCGKKTVIIVLVAVAAFFILCTIFSTTTCNSGNHNWQEATCTDPKVCEKCGETEGKAMGHDYVVASTTDPTCTKAGKVVMTCSRCGDVEEENVTPLGHSVDVWETTAEPTCSRLGKQVGTCTVCGKESIGAIAKLPHTAGEWAITKEATPSVAGEKAQLCAVCGEKIQTQEYELTEDEVKAYCKTYTYEEIARRPDDYSGKYAKFTGEVYQVANESNLSSLTLYTLLVEVTQDEWGYYDDIVYVTYTVSAEADRILEDDIITMYGFLAGTKTYDTLLGENTVPSFVAKYIDIN